MSRNSAGPASSETVGSPLIRDAAAKVPNSLEETVPVTGQLNTAGILPGPPGPNRVGGQRSCREAPFLPPPSEPDWKLLLHPALQ
jgi:hypothetical protein